MKQNITLVTALILAMTSQNSIAGSIADIYTTGDILTPTTMDNVKSAVNDNDTRVTALGSTKQDKANIVTIVGSTTIIASQIGCASAICPTSHPVAIAGGGVPENMLKMMLISSTPRIANFPVDTATGDGQYGSPDGWEACAVNNEIVLPRKLVTTVICANF